VVLGHEASNSSYGRVLTKTNDLVVSLNTVVLEGGKRDVLVLSLDLLGLGVNLLLPLLSSSTETKYKVKCGFLLDVVIGKSASVLELLSGENETLLIRGNSFLILDLSLHIVNGVRRLNIERDSLAYISEQTFTRCIPDVRQALK